MTRVTLGVTSSPYLAICTLQQTAHDFQDQYPSTAPLVLSSFYVDDLLTGAEIPAQEISIYQSLRGLLAKAGFDLRKWRSSSAAVLQAIEPSLHEKLPVQDLVNNIHSQYPKALGVNWDSNLDTMSTSSHCVCPKILNPRSVELSLTWPGFLISLGGWPQPLSK